MTAWHRLRRLVYNATPAAGIRAVIAHLVILLFMSQFSQRSCTNQDAISLLRGGSHEVPRETCGMGVEGGKLQ